MSNDSREDNQIIKASDNIFEDFYDKPRAEILAKLSQFIIDNDFSGLVKYFDEAQSRHDAEREALETKVNNLMTQMLTLEDSNIKLTKEREALVRKCLEICEEHDSHDVSAASRLIKRDIRALLNSDTQGVLDTSGSQE
jgi:hypothetical protein